MRGSGGADDRISAANALSHRRWCCIGSVLTRDRTASTKHWLKSDAFTRRFTSCAPSMMKNTGGGWARAQQGRGRAVLFSVLRQGRSATRTGIRRPSSHLQLPLDGQLVNHDTGPVLHNAVVARNILHIESIVNQLRAEGKNCDDHILSLTTPLMRKHLNPFGRYYFDLNRMRRLPGEIP